MINGPNGLWKVCSAVLADSKQPIGKADSFFRLHSLQALVDGPCHSSRYAFTGQLGKSPS